MGFWGTFSMLFLISNTTKNRWKTFCSNLFGGSGVFSGKLTRLHREFVAIPYAARSKYWVCVLQCTTCNTNVGTPCTCMGERGASPVVWGSLANRGATASVGKFERLLQLVLLRLGVPRALFRMYVSWYFRSFWANFSQTYLTSSCKIVHFIKSDNQFPSISQNNWIAEAPSHPLLNLPFKCFHWIVCYSDLELFTVTCRSWSKKCSHAHTYRIGPARNTFVNINQSLKTSYGQMMVPPAVRMNKMLEAAGLSSIPANCL